MDNKPKYQVVKEKIISDIKVKDLKYNDPIRSELDMMDLFKVSRHTIRRAIADLVNEGWLYRQQGKGTFVDNPEGLKNGTGKSVGVITTYINDYIFPEIISGIEHRISEEGYSMLLGNTNNDIAKERQILTNMMNSKLSGLIVEPTKSVFPNHNKDLYDQLLAKGIPVLFIHACYGNIQTSFIIEDDIKAGYIATKYLIDQGHKFICGIFKQDDMQGHGRYEGYLKALREADLPIDDFRIVWYTTETKKLVLEQFKNISLEKLKEQGTGYVIYNDQIANSFIQKMTEGGVSIPEDLSVVSFDNASIAKNGPVQLTTIAHPKRELGVEAASSLIKLMSKEVTMIKKKFEPELIIRNSVSKLVE